MARDAGADVALTTCATDRCTAIEREYATALQQARRCQPNAKEQCVLSVGSDLACGGCPVHVNTTEALDQIRKSWGANGCDRCVRICPAILCLAPGSAACARNPSPMVPPADSYQCVAGAGLAPL